ncbi:MAG TPA: hypothetical protein VHD83_24860 [Puia sp.]|nr:hypothetical protein [Puia sp.]
MNNTRPINEARKIGALILTAFLYLSSFGQDATPGSLVKDLNDYRAQRLQEKLYVHTDKSFYLAGEICWFKLYYVDASSHLPLDLSKVAYLEWLDKENKPVLQAKIGLKKGHGDGSIYLPLTLRSGNYKLRAYTNWMKNAGVDWFFEKNITVVNTHRSAEMPPADSAQQYDISFLPEGGNLVEGLASRVAFKITDKYGRGVSCTGVITEDDQDTVARFHPERFGIGSFMLTPRPGHHYRSTVRLADGAAINTLLPGAYKEGFVMSAAREDNDHVRVDVLSTTAGSEVYLVAHTRGSVKIAEAGILRDGKTSFLIDKTKLGDGISQLTVFNAAKQPVCERLIFKYPTHRLHFDVRTDKDSYATRKKINLEIVTAGNDKASTADCSLSVFRADGLQTAPEGHLLDYLLLTSDLKGRVESPEYYFDHPEDEQAVDLLMISQGWRRFRWEDVIHHSNPTVDFPPEYNGTIITGRVVNAQTGALDPSIQGYLAMPGTRTQFASAYADDNGKIKFELKDFYGGTEIIVQTNPLTDSNYRIDITSPFIDTYTKQPLPPFILSRSDSNILANKNFDMQVLNRYAGVRLKQFQFPAFDTSTFYVHPDFSYLLDNYTRFTTMEEVMREYVVMMLVKRGHDQTHLPLLDLSEMDKFFEKDPLVLIDGVPVFDLNKLMVLDPLKIRKLETVHQKFFLGSTDYDGIMNWISYKGDLAGYTLDANATVIDYEGLQLQREFYSPSYETEQAATDHLPDYRNVLYWSPDVQVAPKSALSFYSSDVAGKYIVVVEGLAADGTAGSGMASFEVK